MEDQQFLPEDRYSLDGTLTSTPSELVEILFDLEEFAKIFAPKCVPNVASKTGSWKIATRHLVWFVAANADLQRLC